MDVSTVTSSRIRTRVLSVGDPGLQPVLFLHGNLSSATWWDTTLSALPEEVYGIAPDQRGYGDADPSKTIDATRGMGDFSDDAFALLDTLGITRATVVGSSMGGSIVWRMIADHPERIVRAIVVDPGSPYGYGGTKGGDGEPVWSDLAGSGAGLINPEMVERLRNGDTSGDSPLSPRNVFRSLIVRAGYIAPNEDAYVDAMLSTHFGDDAYPGDTVSSDNWPFAAPGIHGAANALSPRWAAATEPALAADPKPSIVWIRGAHDVIISDSGPLDPGTWGPAGLVPGYPGADVYPAQPMVSQTRAWLEEYAAAGGIYDEIVLDDGGHVPYIDDSEAFNGVLHANLGKDNDDTRRSE